jgi:hypothetical protein
MKKKKKIFILSDGRIFFNSVIAFYKKGSILVSFIDIFSSLNWIFISNTKNNK